MPLFRFPTDQHLINKLCFSLPFAFQPNVRTLQVWSQVQFPTLKSRQVRHTILAMWGHNMQGTTTALSFKYLLLLLYVYINFLDSRINKIYCRGDIHVYMNNDVSFLDILLILNSCQGNYLEYDSITESFYFMYIQFGGSAQVLSPNTLFMLKNENIKLCCCCKNELLNMVKLVGKFVFMRIDTSQTFF